MKVKCFKIKCLTNMHVGNGDVNFSIIDNEVERDPVTGFPTINSSGVKGALRVFWNKGESEEDIFGSPAVSGSADVSAGRIKIFTASMIAVPMRASEGDKAYYLVTNETAIDGYNTLIKSFGINKPISKDYGSINCALEGFPCDKTLDASNPFGEEFVLMKEADFRNISLPVIARNKLENGESKNLWYEEIVPHESVFYFFAAASDSDTALLDLFTDKVNDKVIQFGGNSTIGCGYCHVTLIGGTSDE